ncbi:MAG: ABC transporter permease subunit [Proteobacteria bacterium]|nr:ABC transporter permease subunit [Pseudomonadota bacterium]
MEVKQEQQEELDSQEPTAREELSNESLRRTRNMRYAVDHFARTTISLGGIGIIVILLLIFIYLVQEVMPLFSGASVEARGSYDRPGNPGVPTLQLSIEEQAGMAMRLDAEGVFHFFELDTGVLASSERLNLPTSATISSFASDSAESGLLALGLESGEMLLVEQEYDTSFSTVDNSRIVTPSYTYPAGEQPLLVYDNEPVTQIAVGSRGEQFLAALSNAAGDVVLLRGARQQNLLGAFDPDASPVYNLSQITLPELVPPANQLLLDGDLRWLLAIDRRGAVRVFDLASAFRDGSVAEVARANLLPQGANLVDARFLLGGVSLLISSDRGETSQWFLVRDENGNQLQQVRSFGGSDSPIVSITGEWRRKNFVTTDATGSVRIFNTTASRAVFEGDLLQAGAVAMAVAPRGNALLLESTDGKLHAWRLDNPHPEISWSALWERVWYEGYPEPDYIWQSSAASNDFEPKYSLMPLTFGTFKAAFFAMLLAAPLAVCGAIYTGYFMAPRLRRKVKPLVELMEALPTVVLGFLAGLWLAPLVEEHLLSVFSIVVLLPLGIVAASLLWMYLPRSLGEYLPDGWEAVMLVPVVLFFCWMAVVLATPMESLFFGGDLRNWLSDELGVSYDQRNAMVVGLAMGFAVIPTIFSIAEDAIFNVPQQLSYGSQALGATPWQSLYRVVLPTASPGIFSALMVGMGRAVGETMIVLMATGNTPIMDINLFEGMRTLAANIAVEIPESEVDSSHYRILFLAALVLFVFTFFVNTIAEVVRQRLRSRYNVL